MIIERHISPDRLLTLIVDLDRSGEVADCSIGLEGYASHTHGDILAELRGLSEKEAIRSFVDEMLNDQTIFVVSRVNGIIQDIWWIDDGDIESQFKYKPEEEVLEFRFWSGKSAV